MSQTTLSNLLVYLYSALTPQNMMWLGQNLIQRAEKESEMLRPYTMDEINAMIDNAERESAAGEYRTNEEVFKGLLSEDELNIRNYEQEGCLA